MFLILMGVSGCGKTTIGEGVSSELGIPFYDGDDFHPQENIEKMAAGIPLNDVDREAWLNKLRDLIEAGLKDGKSGIIACSALKQKYRNKLLIDAKRVFFVYLKGSFDLIFNRMNARSDHYMKADMLKSQFEALEEPDDVFTVDISRSPNEIISRVCSFMKQKRT